MTALGLPFFFEDTTGMISGPTDFLDIYDRPPFLRLVREHRDSQGSSSRMSDSECKTLSIFELGARTFVNPKRQHGTAPSAVIVLKGGTEGTIKFRTSFAVPIDQWLKKSTRFGSTLTRQFKGWDGMYYQWSNRNVGEHEWACVQLGSNYLVAHYDLKPGTKSSYETPGNVLTIYENFVHLSVELLASLVIMRNIRLSSRSQY